MFEKCGWDGSRVATGARILGLAVLLLCGASTASAQSSLTATLDRSAIRQGERAVLSLTFSGKAPSTAPSIPPHPNLQFSFAGQQSAFHFENGRQSYTVTFNYYVAAGGPGDYVIPSIEQTVDGQTLSTQPLRLRVLKPDPRAADALSRLAFLRLTVPKTRIYLGEILPVEIQLFVQNAQNLQMPQLKGDGFTVGSIVKTGTSQAQVGQSAYQVVIFKTAVSGAKTGSLTLGPAECHLVLRIPSPRSARDPFGFFPNYELRPTQLVSEAETVEVLPLPEANRPPSFNGAVGDFSLAVNASPTNLMVGDPITLTLQIAGRGALDAVNLPPQNWPEFKLYQPTSKIEPADSTGASGVKSFEQAVAPLNADVKRVPAIAFSFFDPDQQTYRTIEHPPIPIQVRPNPTMATRPSALAPASESLESPAASDIVHIKPQLGAITGLHAPLIVRPWFIALQALPLAVWLSAVLWRKRQQHLARNPHLRRRLRVARLISEGLHDLRRSAAANQPEQFFAAVFRLLQEQLGERLDLPSSAITESVVDERLRGDGAPDLLVRDLHALFHLCNQARYAPQRSSQELMSIVPQVEATLKQLAMMKGKGNGR